MRIVVALLCLVLSGCFSFTSNEGGVGRMTGKSFINRTQVCTPQGCTDSPEAIRATMRRLYEEHQGHQYVATGSVRVGVTCPVCNRGILGEVFTQPWAFNPDDDNDDTPHEEDYGVCSNPECPKHGTHIRVPGSVRPAPGNSLPGTMRVRGQAQVIFPDPEVGWSDPTGGFLPLPLSPGVPAVEPFPGAVPEMIPAF